MKYQNYQNDQNYQKVSNKTEIYQPGITRWKKMQINIVAATSMIFEILSVNLSN